MLPSFTRFLIVDDDAMMIQSDSFRNFPFFHIIFLLALLVFSWYDVGMSNDDDNMRREIDSLKEIVEAKMETMEAKNKDFLTENESAIDRLRLSNEKAIERLRMTISIQMVGVVGAGVAILALIIKQ